MIINHALIYLLLWSLAILSLNIPSSVLADETAKGRKSPVPPYKLLRYDEDYSYLRDKENRTDLWDPFKYTPLTDSGETYLSLGGEFRVRYEYIKNLNWGAGVQDSNGYFLQRYLVHSDFHLKEVARLFIQLETSLINGRTGGPLATHKDVLDFHQAFMDLKSTLFEKTSLTGRIGRQELDYGTKLVAVRDGTNTRLSFDGARIIFNDGDVRVDAFAARPVKVRRYIFDDQPDDAQAFAGIYESGPFQLLPDMKGDFYYLYLDRKNTPFNGKGANEKRHTAGARLWGKRIPWDYNNEFVIQWGRSDGGNILAYAAMPEVSYTASSLPLTPRFVLHGDIASGDRNFNDNDMESFNPLFERSWFNFIDLVNVIDVRPQVVLHGGEKIALTIEYGQFWRNSIRDGFYTPYGPVLARNGQQSSSRDIGGQLVTELIWRFTHHTNLTAYYVHVFPGRFFRETPPSEPFTLVTAYVTYTF